MEHVEVRHAHLFTWSLVQWGVVAVGTLVVIALVVGLVVWRRSRRPRNGSRRSRLGR